MNFDSSASSPKQNNPADWSIEEINVWFEKMEWLNGWDVKPYGAFNKRDLAIYYHKNPERWEKAFQFLKLSDLKNLPIGKQELDGKNLFVAISEYTTKNKSEARYEAHKKYIDFQYVIEGEELIGLTTFEMVEVTEPYNEEKDVEFYSYDGGEYIKATPENLFVFFPNDVHRPSIKVEDNISVKKIVVKLKID